MSFHDLTYWGGAREEEFQAGKEHFLDGILSRNVVRCKHAPDPQSARHDTLEKAMTHLKFANTNSKIVMKGRT